MSGHSKSTSDQFFIYPFLSINQFSVGRNVLNDGDFLTFEGNYNATGFIRLYDPDQRDVHFTGQGRWMLKSNEVLENLAYGNFSLDSNGFVDVSLSNKVWVFTNKWSDINFEGLKIDNGGSKNDEELKIEAMKILADIYSNFLRGPFLPELQEYNPTRKLLMVHIQELLKTKTLEDIISDYEPPSTPPKYTQTTDAPSRSTSLMVGNVLWMLFMIQLCVY